ncbi:MAG: CapA family protein [Acidobacteriia bacterium]|nr:CapA family protein [Terriglobia bacterium]
MTTTRRNLLLLPALALLPRRTGRSAGLPTPPPGVRILFAGDIMLSRYVGRLAHEKKDPTWPLHDVAALLASADLAFANLESPFSDHGKNLEKGMVFRAEPEMIAALTAAGIDIVSTANNHARDCGSHGIEFTLDLLARNGIKSVGTGTSRDLAHEGVVIPRNGVGFGFLGYTFDQSNGNHADRDDRVAMLDIEEMTTDVKRLLERCDVAIVSMHAGTEYQPNPNSQQQRFARAAIDAGATLVVGHHPHVTQPVETYQNGLIFYSLGNLVFDQFQRKETQQGWIADVRFMGPRIAGYGVIPVDIVKTVPKVHLAS